MKISKLFWIITLCASCHLQGASWFTYIADGSNGTNGVIEVFDVQANAYTPDSPLLNANSSFFAVAITPDAQTAYFVDRNNGTLVSVDIPSNTLTTIPVANAQLSRIAITPNGTSAFIASTTPAGLFRVNLTTLAVTPITLTGALQPFGVAVTPDGKKVYVSDTAGSPGRVFIVDVATNTEDPAGPINVGAGPFEVSVSPDGERVYVLNAGDNTVSVIDIATNAVIDTIAIPTTTIGAFVSALAINSKGTQAYVAVTFDNVVVPINLATNTVGTPIPLNPGDTFPAGIALTPNGKTAFVVNFNTITRINNVNGTPTLQSFPLAPGQGTYDAVTPDQAPTALFSFVLAKAGSPSTFNASASSSPVGTIAKYTWNFGDGTAPVTTNNPHIAHTFAAGGTFHVTLTVTNTGGTSITRTFTGQTVSNNGGPSARLIKTVNIEPSVSPPIDLRGNQVKEEFATQTDLINVLRWSPPTSGETPVSYKIYRDAALTELIGTVPASHLTFEDHNRHPHIVYTYFVVSVDAAGQQSPPTEISVP